MVQTIMNNDRRIDLDRDDFVVTKSDLSGNITYVNRAFLRISGFTEKELLGQPHSINRHPDMPRIIFKLAWERIHAGNEFCGYVKNRCHDNTHYWFFTNITPSYSLSGELTGYQSVRRHAREEALDVIRPLYAELLEAEHQAGPDRALEASRKLLQSKLDEQRTDYDHFILAL
ncbi:MAG: PAS domain-containing protein [Sedimenticola sp.]